MLAERLHKYPRTRHLEGSRLQPGDDDLDSVPFDAVRGRHLVVEEKMDGANAAVSFSSKGELRLQSRGHFLTGGDRERHFDLFKRWARAHQPWLWQRLGARHVLFGEWLYAKHTVFYNALPHYFLEFDVLDREEGCFLDTPRRRSLLGGEGSPIVPVRVLRAGHFDAIASLTALLGESAFIRPPHLVELAEACRRQGLDPARALEETDPETLMEGLYLKIEEDGAVTERYKFVRTSFLTRVLASESHWQERPIIPNRLQDDVDLFAATAPR